MENKLTLLKGIKVVELATFVAAPSCARILADWGADVVKVEAPSGDYMRSMGMLVGMPTKEDENIAFDQQNSNKRGIVLNLKEKEGKEILYQLLKTADVFVTNNRENALVKLGISYEQLKESFPKLIYAQMLGYGENGPDKAKPGYDFTAYYARGGISGTLYEKGTSPVMTVAGFGDQQAGLYLAAGVCAALYKARESGKGEKVSVSLLHTAIYSMQHMVASSQYGNNPYPRSRKEIANPLQGIYQTKDARWVQLGMNNYDAEYPRVCKMLGREDLLSNKAFITFDAVQVNPRALIDILDEEFIKKDIDQWLEIMKELDMPADKAMLWEEILEDEQVWANDILTKLDGFPNNQERIVVNTPVRFKEMGLPSFHKGPKLGENTEEILVEHGYTPQEISRFKDNEIIG